MTKAHVLEKPAGSTKLAMTGIILCGGRSTRMGRQKAFLPYKGKSLIEHNLDMLSEIFSELVLVSNDPAEFEHLSANVLRDILPDRGPIVGILSGLLVSHYEQSFVMACDMPFLTEELIRTICRNAKENQSKMMLYAYEGQIEALLGVYSSKCIKEFEEALFKDVSLDLDFLASLEPEIFNYMTLPSSQALRQLPHYSIDTPSEFGKLCTMN